MRSIYRLTIRKGFLCLGACLIAIGSMAQQDTLYIDLGKLLEVGGANNLTIEQFRIEQSRALADVAKARNGGCRKFMRAWRRINYGERP